MPTESQVEDQKRRKHVQTLVANKESSGTSEVYGDLYDAEEEDGDMYVVRGALINADGSVAWSPGALDGQRSSFFQEVARGCELDSEECGCGGMGKDCPKEHAPCRYRQSSKVAPRFEGGQPPTNNNPFGSPFFGAKETAAAKRWTYNKVAPHTAGSLPIKGGVNQMLLHIVTRWKRDEGGMPIDRGGKNLMEFVAFKRFKDDDMWTIPAILDSEVRNSANSDSKQVERTHFDSAVNQYAFTRKNFKDGTTETQMKFVQEQVDQLFYVPQGKAGKGREKKQNTYPFLGKTIYQGFMDDERATSSAWVNVKVVIHHDERGVLDAYNLEHSKPSDVNYTRKPHPSTPAPAEVAWLTLHQDLDLCGEEEDLLQHVASIHGAYW
jgi:hypothetical protein